MPENIECEDCGTRILGFSSGDPQPIARNECPNCGAAEFTRLTAGD